MLINDIIVYICNHLDDRSKIQWLSVCKQHRALIGKITINRRVCYSKVFWLDYRNIFGYVCVDIDICLHGGPELDEFTRLHTLRLMADAGRPMKLPASLRNMIFPDRFNRAVNLPAGLRRVVFGDKFNQAVTLPPSLQYVKFGSLFNAHVDLPDGIICVLFGVNYHKPVKFPSSLKKLTISSYYNHPIPSHTRVYRI